MNIPFSLGLNSHLGLNNPPLKVLHIPQADSTGFAGGGFRASSGASGGGETRQSRRPRCSLSRWTSRAARGPHNTPRCLALTSWGKLVFLAFCHQIPIGLGVLGRGSPGVFAFCVPTCGVPRKAPESDTQHLGPCRAQALGSLRVAVRRSGLRSHSEHRVVYPNSLQVSST